MIWSEIEVILKGNCKDRNRLETLPDRWPHRNRAPGWKGTAQYSSTNSSLQISIFQIHQIFNISYFPQLNLSLIPLPKCPKITQKFPQNSQTVVNEISREIQRCLKLDRDIGRKAVLSYVKNSLHVYPCLNVISEFPYKLLYFRLSSPYKPLYYAWATCGINFPNDGPSTNFSDEYFCESSQDVRLLIPLPSPFNSFYRCLIVILGYEKITGHYQTASSLSFPRKSLGKNAKQVGVRA